MVRKDYILRMIEQIVAVIHELAGLKIAQNYAAALGLLDATYPRLTGLDGDVLRNAAPETLLQLLSFGGVLDANRCIAAAELLKEDGDIRAALDQDSVAYACYDRALFLFVTLVEIHGSTLLDGRLARIDAVADAIAVYELPVAVGRRLFDYYRMTHRYADAETWLFRVLAAAPGDADTARTGVAFYTDLLERTDRELAVGGLTRTEAEAGLAELREREEG